MAKIAVVGANGKAGSLIVSEALARGAEVTAIVRSENTTEATSVITKDAMELTAADLAGFDVVVDAVGAWTESTVLDVDRVAQHLCDVLSGTDTRLLIVGGAGSLYTNPEHTLTVADAPDFPDVFKPVAAAHQEALDHLRERSDVAWTYISPAADFQAEAARTGEYIAAGEDFEVNERGESVISYADYAIALIDEALEGAHIRERISFLGK